MTEMGQLDGFYLGVLFFLICLCHTHNHREKKPDSSQSPQTAASDRSAHHNSCIFFFFFCRKSNQIKSRKQNVSQSVSTALPLHVASRDPFFFFLTSKLGNIHVGNTLETKNEIAVWANRLAFPALVPHV